MRCIVSLFKGIVGVGRSFEFSCAVRRTVFTRLVLNGPELGCPLPAVRSSDDSGPPSRSVKLNGKVLMMVDDKTLPDLEGSSLPPAEHLQLPAYSLAFFVFTDAKAAGCL